MAIARTALALAPMILKTRLRRPVKRMAGAALSLGLLVMAGLFLLIAGFVWIMKSYGAEFGFLAVGLFLCLAAGILYFLSRPPKEVPKEDRPDIDADMLTQYLPEEMQSDPRFLALIKTIKEHPTGSTAAAVSLGFIISTQLFGD